MVSVKVLFLCVLLVSLISYLCVMLTMRGYKKMKKKYDGAINDIIALRDVYYRIADGQDRLEIMFEKQKAFQNRLSPQLKLPCDSPRDMASQVTALVAEIGEILECDQRWKPWRSNPPLPDDANKRMEISDAFHFLINIALYSDMDSFDVFNEFIMKNAKNNKRQDNKY